MFPAFRADRGFAASPNTQLGRNRRESFEKDAFEVDGVSVRLSHDRGPPKCQPRPCKPLTTCEGKSTQRVHHPAHWFLLDPSYYQ